MPVDSTRAYLVAIGRHELLKPEEELTLGRQVKLMLQPPEGLSEAEFLRIQKEGKRAKERMVCSNLRLVVNIAKKYKNRGLDLLDLVQEGAIGLERAAEKFDYTQGWKFSTYAYWWIRQGITRAIAQNSRAIRLPVHVTEKLNKVKGAQRELSQMLGRAPTIEEISSHTGMGLEAVRQTIRYHIQATRLASLEQSFGQDDDDPKTLQTVLPSSLPGPLEVAEREDRRKEVENLMSQADLGERERLALRLRFGLLDGQEHSLAAVGEMLGVSRERVRQMEFKSLNKLRSAANR